MNLADAIRQAAIQRAQAEPAPAPAPTTSVFPISAAAPEPVAPVAPAPPVVSVASVEEETHVAPIEPEVEVVSLEFHDDETLEDAVEAPEYSLDETGVIPPAPPQPYVGMGTAVRLELFLQPDQLSALLRNVVNSQHQVMTLRETAYYLRVSQERVEEMAVAGEIPAFELDGKWRFPRAGVEEWLLMRSVRKEKKA